MLLPVWVSTASLVVSFIALYFTFKKDAHRIRLTLNYGKYGTSDYISINNDSSFPVRVSSVGYIDESESITWLEKICEAKENVSHLFPVEVGARSTYQGIILGRHVSSTAKYGYCVQLDCGRTFTIQGRLSKKIATKLKTKSFISWLSSGRLGFEKNNVHISKYN